MTKDEIIKTLKNISISIQDIIILGEASLVMQDILSETKLITIACSKDTYEALSWEKRLGTFNIFAKYQDNIEVISDLCIPKEVKKIANYRVTNLDSTYELLAFSKNKIYKKTLEKLEYLLCENNSFYWYEKNLRQKSINYIAGVDEVGRGPLVGPVVAACVVLPEKFSLDGLTDSKKLTEKKRNYFYEEIRKQALGIGIGIIDEKKIDEINIYEATKLAMYKAIAECQKCCPIEHILIDAMPLDLDIDSTSIIKGDLKSITISAASVIAKVTRDSMLYELDKKYPMYDFKNNKGYGTKTHLEAIKKYGILKEHRRSYAPVKDYLDSNKIEKQIA